MATKSCDGNTSVSHSSIALLQERFRQLQKAKEMREEKELLRLLSESGRTNNINRAGSYEQTGMLFHSEAGHINPQRSQTQQQGSMFQQPKFERKNSNNLKGNEIPIFGNMFSSTTTTTTTGAVMQYYRTNNIDDDDDDDNGSEVDTSLRL